MRTRTLTLTVAALATFTALGTVVATARTTPATPAADHAAVMMGVGNPHGSAFTVASAEPAANEETLKQWENIYSRDVWPGMGVANVHVR